MSIEGLLGSVSRCIWRYDQDYSDRLHTTVTSNILVALAGVASWKTWAGGSPIECAIPAMFSESVSALRRRLETQIENSHTLRFTPAKWLPFVPFGRNVLGRLRENEKLKLFVIMVMIETFLGMAKYLSPREDDDWSDRLNYLMTPNILLAFSVLISFKQFGGRPIECMFPNKFPGSWEQYAENYCWSQDTYFVEPTQDVSLLKKEERYTPDRQLSYYQWVPFFLLLQAAFFRAPSYLWKYFSNHSGIRIHEVVEKAKDSANVEEEVREKNILILKRHLSSALRFQANMERKKVQVHKTVTFLNFQYSSGFISWIYLFTKVLYFLNVFAQLYLMNYFLGTNRHHWYGFGVVQDIVQGEPWERSGYFPRAAVCDFEVRQVANIQRYSVQCVLVINIFNEKIFVLLWFWYVILLLSSTVSLVQWFIVLVFPCFSKWFVKQHLALSTLQNFNQRNSRREDSDVSKFVTQYLHKDGVFVLRMVSSHAGIIFATDLVQALYEAYDFQDKNKDVQGSPVSDDLQTISTGAESSIRQRKTRKGSRIEYKAGFPISTSLMPDKDDIESSSTSSEEDQKRVSNVITNI